MLDDATIFCVIQFVYVRVCMCLFHSQVKLIKYLLLCWYRPGFPAEINWTKLPILRQAAATRSLWNWIAVVVIFTAFYDFKNHAFNQKLFLLASALVNE